MDVVPLAVADLSPVLGPAWEADPALRAVLTGAAGELLALADELGVRAGWTGSGLEYLTAPGQNYIAGFVELPEASFYVELLPPNFYRDGRTGWQIEAIIQVRCDARNDCGMHLVETVAEVVAPSAHDAVQELASAIYHLVTRVRSFPLGHWRAIDPTPDHP